MKYIFWITIILFLINGTCKARDENGAVDQANFINQYGEWHGYSNLWVTATPDGGKISVKYREIESIPDGKDDISTVQTADDWRTKKGWFVFAESPERIWIYNGSSLRLLLITPKIGSTIYAEKYPIVVPLRVKAALAKLQ